MKTTPTFALASAALSLTLSVGAQEIQPATQGSPRTSQPRRSAPPSDAKPYDDIIKLWRANLSEEFLQRHIENGTAVYNLTAEDIIRCRDAGIPETLIESMIRTARAPATPSYAPAQAAPAPAPPPAAYAQPPTYAPPPAYVPPPVTALGSDPSGRHSSNATTARASYGSGAVPTPVPPPAMARWDGLVRRTGGIVIKSRWKDAGVLELKEDSLRWVDADEPDKNLLVPVGQIREQFLTCLKKAGPPDCFEWGFKIKGEEYYFRDVSWQQSENQKPTSIYDLLKESYPTLVSSQVPAKKK